MATAYIRIKVELPDDEAARFVLDKRGPEGPLKVQAKDIVAALTGRVLADLLDSPIVTDYHAQISLAPR